MPTKTITPSENSSPSFIETFKNKVFPKLETLFWFVTAIYQIKKYELYNLHKHPNLNEVSFLISILCFSFDILLFLVLSVYKDFLTPKNSVKRGQDLSDAYPVSIYLATGVFVVGATAFNYAIWPIFKWMTPIVSFCQFMLFIIVVAKLPGGKKSKVE